MSDTRHAWDDVERIFHEAVALDGEARTRYLDAVCAGRPSLRREVDRLIAFDAGAGAFLEGTALDETARAIARAEATRVGRDIGGYRIVERIGLGGMGEVYRARDDRLGRDVAVKILTPLVAGEGPAHDRLVDEARAASRLNHPNIVTIYGAGGDEAMTYIAMELVDGRTLAQEMERASLPPARVLDIAVQLTDALAAAHAAGIVHRDLKPDNVMVTREGLVKVLDFGIATRRDAAVDTLDHAATGAGPILGTAGYMSPEQARGAAADHRSDQFSLGVILYELVCGRRAFAAETRTATLEAIVSAEPPPLSRDAATSPLDRVIRRCLSKSPAARYADTAELAREIHRIQEQARHAAAGLMTRRRVLWYGASAAGVVAAAGTGLFRWRTAGPKFNTVAVLPFANAAKDPDVQFVCDGLASVLVEWLWRLPPLHVVPASAGLSLQPRAVDTQTAGHLLHADAVVDGRVAREGHDLLITARLVEIASGAVRWSATYQRAEGALLGLQQDLALDIARAVGVELGVATRDRLVRAATTNPAAHTLFLRGLFAHRQSTEEDYLVARDLFERAIALDPQFTRAMVALASTYSVSVVDGYERPIDAWLQSKRYVRRALRLDPDLPDAHAESASMAFLWDWDSAEADHEFAAALASRVGEINVDLLDAFALERWAVGRTDEALHYAGLARALDPISAGYAVREADLRAYSGELDAAAALYRQIIRGAPDDSSACFGLADVLHRQGRADEATSWLSHALCLAHSDDDPDVRAALSAAVGADGYRRLQRASARAELATCRARTDASAYVSPLDLARAHAQLDQWDLALDELESAVADRAAGLVFLKVDHVWDPVRTDRRFAKAVAAVTL